MRFGALVIGVVVLAALSAPAGAQIKLDMNKVTCGDWLGYGPEERDFVRFFMSGYYSAAANSDVLDYNRLQKNSRKVMAFCKTHKSDTLPTAIKKSAS
jgi:acid stress chaperone HdeB